ncbi:MAG: hypothetical protein IKK44_01620 [Clostridium sp.]|nr:hypothetical protein [Clostridium sp.]
MEQKNRLILTAAVILLIVGAMFTSFGRSFFTMDTPEITLPSAGLSSPDNSAGGSTDHYLAVEVTPKTVQSIVATLTRTDSYYREVTVERFWGETESASSLFQVWVDQGWTHVRQSTASGAVRHDIIGPDNAFYWYEGSYSLCTAPVDQASADLAQQMPTYETVLTLEQDAITDAGYESRGGFSCVYVETTDPELELTHRYWVDIQSGLLISAEIQKGAAITYRLTAYTPIQSPCPSSASFVLPDGSTTHSTD